MAAQDVHRAALAVLRERDFHGGQPLPGRQNDKRSLDQRGVAFVEQAVRGRAIPPSCHVSAAACRSEYAPHAIDCHLARSPGFDQHHVASRDVRRSADIDLAQAATPADLAQDLAEAFVVGMHA